MHQESETPEIIEKTRCVRAIHNNPQRRGRDIARVDSTLSELGHLGRAIPKVGRCGQPWAELRIPFGERQGAA